ncbi:hypothetical protein RI367_007174 [Sorochytrium milnesiophthora]
MSTAANEATDASSNSSSGRVAPVIALVSTADDAGQAARDFASELTQKTVSSLPCRWRIATKYYSVDVTLESVALHDEHEDSALESVEAVILLVGDAKSDVTSVVGRLRRGAPSAEICLCVLTSATMPDTAASRWSDVCIEHGFELISYADSADDESDGENESAVKGLQDTFGIDRVREALESHMWPGLHLQSKETEQEHESMDAIISQFFAAFDAGGRSHSGDGDDGDGHTEPAAIPLRSLDVARDAASAMSDTQRRDFAERFAMKMMQVVGDLHSDDEHQGADDMGLHTDDPDDEFGEWAELAEEDVR